MTSREGGEGAARAAQATGHPRPRQIIGWIGGWGCVLALSFWLAQLSVVALLCGAVGAAAWTWSVQGEGRRRWLTVGLFWLAVVIGASVQLRLREVATSWPELQREIEARSARALNAELDGLVTHGERAVAALGRELQQAEEQTDSSRLFTRLELIRRAEDLSALAIFDRRGEAVAWAGEHRGQIPVAVQRGSSPYVFYEGPLFSYLYFVYPLRAGGTAVAGVLLEASLETADGELPFAARFEENHGLLPVFTYPNRAVCPSIWDWSVDRAILSACFTELSQSYWWGRVQERGRWEIGGLLLLLMSLLTLRWYRRRMPFPGLPVGLITVALLLAPLGPMLGTETLFSPSQFVLPRMPWDVSLGVLLLVLTSGSVWLLTRAGGGRPGRIRFVWWGQALAVAILLPLVLHLMRVSTGAILAARPAGGFLLQLSAVLLLGLPLFLLLLHSRKTHLTRFRPITLLLGGIGVAAVLAVLLALQAGPESPSALWASLWALAFAPISLALPHLSARYRPVRAWLTAGLVAATCVLPTLWTWHVEAKLRNAEERELSRLGTEANPYLDFRLRVFAEKAQDFAAEGESGVNLLYHSWIESRLAEEGYEARLTIWRNGTPLDELRLTQLTDTLPSVVQMMVERHEGLESPIVQLHTRVEGLHYLLLVPLAGGRTLSVAVPPRSRLAEATPLARFLHQQDEPDAASAVSSLFLVPSDNPVADSIAADRASGERAEWLPTESGWRSEAAVRYPSGWMHVHLVVRTSTLPMLLIRGVLLTAALVGMLFLIWLAARLICRDLGDLPILRPERLRSFRSRLTLTLFAFFLIPAGIFSAVAYSAVAREVILSAEAFARRTLEQTVEELSPGAPLWNVAEEVDADLLLYRGGTLEVAPAPEILELGLFDTWLPPAVHLAFASGDDLEAVDQQTLGQNEYLVAYRMLEGGVVLAAPIALARDDIARRQSQFRDIALLLSLVGAALSVVLSFLVGRALTRPIEELSRAAATIGAGNLQVRLPDSRPDEFGSVYRSFNRMATRLRRARTALIRETRRTETIVAEAATGVLALDGDADVELVNPRAAEILEAPLDIGKPLPRTTASLRAVAEAFDRFWRSRELEAGAELEVEGRMLRLRMRRLTSAGEPGGAVVALEDVTREVRSARVLAWGEMARQVAHEIKNPLTPIKLAVQHLRRAHRDRRPDYEEILERNVQSILLEIDRLGEIARAFARFGTPDEMTERLETLDVAGVVEETLMLYRGAGEGIRYVFEVDPSHGVTGLARRGELKEVLINLLENAREAVGEKGEIRVSVNGVDRPDRVEVAVVDTGEGIPSELLARVFEPHFSTRTSGTGLGLAIVRRMVESWGGEVVAESEAGRGTRVRVLIPRGGGEQVNG